MIITETKIPGLQVIEPDVFSDSRGFFMETWNSFRYHEMGIDAEFIQDNLSFSAKDSLRGLHFQNPGGQGKLVYVLQGEIFDVAVDIRTDSPTFGQWLGMHLTADNKKQLFIPSGFAHGFYVTSDTALLAYKCTEKYMPHNEMSIAWNDPDIGIDWPIVKEPILSEKDTTARLLQDIPKSKLP